MSGASLGDWHESHCYIVTEQSEIDNAYQLLIRKYSWQMHLINFFSRLSGRINKRAVIRIEPVD